MTDAPIRKIYTDLELLYSATSRCRCGAGLAYPHAKNYGSWMCSAVLKSDSLLAVEAPLFQSTSLNKGDHDDFPWAFFKVREETSINNRRGHTTRPAGTIARSQGFATCPNCQHKWNSEPYDATGASHHWVCGPCPSCAYAVGAGLTSSTREGPRIDVRIRNTFLVEPPK